MRRALACLKMPDPRHLRARPRSPPRHPIRRPLAACSYSPVEFLQHPPTSARCQTKALVCYLMQTIAHCLLQISVLSPPPNEAHISNLSPASQISPLRRRHVAREQVLETLRKRCSMPTPYVVPLFLRMPLDLIVHRPHGRACDGAVGNGRSCSSDKEKPHIPYRLGRSYPPPSNVRSPSNPGDQGTG